MGGTTMRWSGERWCAPAMRTTAPPPLALLLLPLLPLLLPARATMTAPRRASTGKLGKHTNGVNTPSASWMRLSAQSGTKRQTSTSSRVCSSERATTNVTRRAGGAATAAMPDDAREAGRETALQKPPLMSEDRSDTSRWLAQSGSDDGTPRNCAPAAAAPPPPLDDDGEDDDE